MKGALSPWLLAECGTTGCTATLNVAHTGERGAAIRALQDAGWVQTYTSGWLCPVCVAKWMGKPHEHLRP